MGNKTGMVTRDPDTQGYVLMAYRAQCFQREIDGKPPRLLAYKPKKYQEHGNRRLIISCHKENHGLCLVSRLEPVLRSRVH